MRIQTPCPECGKNSVETSSAKVLDMKVINLSCGHLDIVFYANGEVVQAPEDILSNITFDNGKVPRSYQRENALFALKHNFRCVFGDDTGLGKTLSTTLLFRAFPERTLPGLIICKAALKAQWWYEVSSTIGITPQILGAYSDPDPDSQLYIVSYDFLKNANWLDGDEEEDDFELFSPKTIILDECQMIKNSSSKRTNAVMKLVSRAENVIGVSADPGKNNAGEYYPILHMLDPRRFSSYQGFIRDWVDSYFNGFTYKLGGIKRYRKEEWDRVRGEYIIRHRREDVAPELPKEQIGALFTDLSNGNERAYRAQELILLDSYERQQESFTFAGAGEVQTNLFKLKHIAGQCKIAAAVDYIKQFCEDNPDRKITAFVHHKDVGDGIIEGLADWCVENGINAPKVIRGGMGEGERNKLVGDCAKFGWVSEDPKDQILIASTLAAGEGINLQKCADVLMVERQWNYPNERQAAPGRFSRIGSEHSTVFITYLILTDRKRGTIDEILSQVIARKKAAMDQTRDGIEGDWKDEDVYREVMEMLSGAREYVMDQKLLGA